MLLGDARARDERGLDIEKTEDCVLDGERIRDERAANCRGARMEAFGRGQIREFEERPIEPGFHYNLIHSNRCTFSLPGIATQSTGADLLGTLKEILAYGIGGLFTPLNLFIFC